MITTIDFSDFQACFNAIRPDNFSYAGLKALFDYLEEYEQGMGEKIGLDVIALCCDFCELSHSETEAKYDMSIEEIRDNTTVIDVDEDTVVIQSF